MSRKKAGLGEQIPNFNGFNGNLPFGKMQTQRLCRNAGKLKWKYKKSGVDVPNSLRIRLSSIRAAA